MPDITKNLHPNTVAFACLQEPVAILIVDIVHAIYLKLNWRPSSKSFLLEILARIDGNIYFECSHLDFANILFPSLEENVRKVKISRWAKKLIADMTDSLFNAVWIDSRRKDQTQNGKWYGLPTLYKRGHFWDLFRAVQDAALECDLYGMPQKKRRQKVRVIVEKWLDEKGAIKIIREKKEQPEKSEKQKADKSDSLPCKCDCANCKKCATKPIAALESEPVLSVQIQRERERLREIEEEFVLIGQAMLNRGGKLSVADSKINAIATAARARLKAAVNHQNGRNDYAPQAGERSRGRTSQEVAVSELREMRRIAEGMGQHQHAEKLEEWARALESWKLFQMKNGLKLVGGQPK